MKLGDLRKLAIRKQVRIRFPLKNGMECVVNEHGVAQVAALKTQPDFNLEHELAAASTFVLEPVTLPGVKNPPKPQSLDRAGLSSLTGEAPGAAHAHDDHEDE